MQQMIKKNNCNTYYKAGRSTSQFKAQSVRKILCFILCLTLLLQMLPAPLFIKQAGAEETKQTTYEQYLALGQSILKDKETDFSDTALLSGQTISKDTTLSGDYVLSGGVLRIDEGATLTIDGDFAMNKGSLVVKGTLQITGDVWLSGGYITLSDTIHIQGSCYNISSFEDIDNTIKSQTATLTMNRETAQFIVDKNLLWQGEELLEDSKGALAVSGDCVVASSQTDYSDVGLKLIGETDQRVAVIAITNTEEMEKACEEYVTVKSLTTTHREKEKEGKKKGDKEPVQITMIASVVVAEELELDYPVTGAIACKEKLLNKLGSYQGDLIIAEKTKLSQNLTVEGNLEIAGDVTVDDSITLQVTDNLTVVKDAALTLQAALQLTAGGNVNTGAKKINGANNLCLTLNGAKAQTVMMEIKEGELLKQLTLNNNSKEGIVFEKAFPVADFTNKDTAYKMPGQERYGYTLQKDETLDSMTLMGGNLNLNGHTLTINNDLELAYGQLVMQNTADQLIVKGDVSVTSKQQQKGSVNAGVLCFQGEENQHYKNPTAVLQPEWNKVVLANQGTLYLDSDLTVTQELTYQCKQVAGTGIINVPDFPKHTGKLTGNYCITRDMEWKDTVTIEGDVLLDASLKMMGGSLTCQNFTIRDTGALIMEGGNAAVQTAVVYGDLHMTDAKAEFTVAGDIKLRTNLLLAKNLSAGTLAVAGEFDNETGKVYATAKEHKTILNQLPGKNGVLQTQKLSMQKASLGSIAHLVLNKRKEYYALNISDDIEALSGDVIYQYTDTTAPEQVTGIKADNITMTGFDVSWDAASDDYGTVGYIVYIDGVQKGETKENKYSFTNLTYHTSYAVSIVAYDTGNNHSDVSESVTVVTGNDDVAPTKPAISHDNSTGKAITLSWTKSSDNIGVAGYYLYRDGEKIADVQATEYRDSTAQKEETYTYQVTAYDEAGNESEKSKQITAALHPIKITSLTCPAQLFPDRESEPAELTLSAYKRENVEGISVFYKRQSKTDGQDAEEEYQILKDITPEVTDKGYRISLNNIALVGGSYILRFVITDVDGDEDSRECRLTLDSEAPDKVTGLTMLRRTGSSIVMQWNQAIDNVAIQEYHIYRDGEYIAATPDTCYKDSGLKNHEAHSYQILAIDTSGNKGELCDAVEMMPLAPMFITVTPTDLASVGGKKATFSALFYDTGNARGNRLYVEYSEDGENYTRINEEGALQQTYRYGVLKAEVTVNLTTLPSKALYIRYILVDEDYNRTIKDVQYVVDTKGAEPPEEIRAESVNGVNVLIWKPSVSADCRYYEIYRRTEDEKQGAETLLAEVAGKDSASYEDAGVQEGVTYHYYVRAFDLYRQTEGKSEEVFVETSRDEEAPVMRSIQPMAVSVNKVVTLRATAVDNKVVKAIRYSVKDAEGNVTLLAESAADENGTASYEWDTTGLDGSYTILLEAVDASGNYSVKEFSKTYLVDNKGPEQPVIEEVNAYQNSLSVSFSYPEAEDYDYMKVQVMKGEEVVKEKKVYNYLNALVEELIAGETYQVVLTAYDTLGNASKKSEAATVTLKKDEGPPKLVTQSPAASFVGEKLELCATATDNEGIAAMKYLISKDQKQWETLYQKEYSDAPKEAEFNYTYSTLSEPEGTIYIRVYMMDSAGNESYGNDIISYRIDHTAPQTVTALKAQAEAGRVQLSWEQNEDKDIESFEVYRANEGDTEYKCIGSTGSLYYKDNSAQRDTVYSYQIRCVDRAGNIGPFSSPVTSGAYEDREAPKITSMAAPVEECKKGVQKVYVVAKDNSALSRVTLSYCHSAAETPIWHYFGEAKIGGTNDKAVFDLSVAQLLDGEYRLRALCYDVSGNESVAYEITYLSDQTAPGYSNYQIEEGNYQLTLSWQTNEDAEATIYRKNEYEKDFSVVASTEESSYTDTSVAALEPYTYYVVWKDAYGNETKGELLYGSAKDVDTVKPEPYIAGDAIGMTGYDYILDGIQSTDNVHIRHYKWEISDGAILTGAKAIHRFKEAGTYEVTLTVTDDSGNSASCSKTVTVIDRVSAGVVTVNVTDTKGNPIPYADVYLNLSEESKPNFVTDEKGVAVIKANAGTYQCAAYKSGYQAKECSVKVLHGEQKKVTLVLPEGDTMKVALSSRELTMQEILDYGIDLDDPANHHVYVVEYSGEYAPYQVVYDWSKSGGEPSSRKYDVPMASGPGTTKGSGGGAGMGSGGTSSEEQGGSVGHNEIPPNITIKVSATVSWLKEMYEIKCDITNLADSSLVRLQDVAATLNLPEGLSLAATAKRQTMAVKVDGDIGGMEQKSVTWVVRGDKPGVYGEEVYADVSGRLMPFGRSIESTAKLKTGINVFAGKGLVITLQVPFGAMGGSVCDINIKLSNEGQKNFHDVKFYTSAGNGEVFFVDGSANTEDGYDEEGEIVEVDMGDVVNVLELAPGMSVTAHTSFTFPINLDEYGREKYYWKLVDEKLEEITGANLGVLVRVEYIPARYTPNFSQYIVDDGLDGDPVRLSDGALIDELSFLDIQGVQEYGLTLEHDSNLANCEGDLGGGWYSNYSNYLSVRGREVDLYWTQGSFSRFESTDDSYWEKDEKKGSYTYRYSNDASKTCTYKCLSETIGSSYTLTRNKDSYTLTKRTGEKYYFDSKGNLTGIEDNHGRKLSVTLNGSLRRFNELKKRKRKEGGAAGTATMVIEEEATGSTLALEYIDTSYGSVIRRAYTNDGREVSFGYLTKKIDLTPEGAESKEKYYREISYLESISLKKGGILYKYTYDDKGHLITGKDAKGITYMTNTYDRKGRVIEQKDGNDTATKYQYDTESEYLRTITNITYADGSNRRQVSNEGGQIIRDIDERGNQTTYTYDKYGNQTSMTDALGASHVYEYNNAGDMVADIDVDDNQITMEYDGRGNVTQVTDAKGNAESYTYDNKNCLIKKTNGKRITTYSYNDNCQLIREETYSRDNPSDSQRVEYIYLNSQLVTTTTRKSRSSEADTVQRYSYDAAGNIECIADGEGNRTTYSYDEQGQMLSETIEGATTQYRYDTNKEPSQITYADGSKVCYERNNAYQVEKEIYYDAAGAVTKTICYRYDKRGNVLSQCLSNAEDTEKHQTSYTYDKAGNLLTQTEEDGSKTVYRYDAKNRVEKQTDSSGISTSYTYYPNGKVSREERRIQGTEGKPLQSILYNYDRNWNLVETDDSISGVTGYTYDAMGQLIETRDGLGNKTSLSYDVFGNLIKSTDPRGNATTYTYNSAGQCTSMTEPMGEITEYSYDKAGRNTAITLKENEADQGSTTRLFYDGQGNLSSQQDACGHEVSYSYDKATGDVTDIKDSRGNILFHYDYDSEGQLTQSTDSYGTVTTYQYDLLGNLTRTESQVGSQDNADNQSLTEGNRAQSYLYDSMGRMIKATDATGGITKAGYDEKGNMTALSNPEESKTEGLHTSYEYDSSNRLIRETNSIGMTVSLSYNEQQQVESRTDSRTSTDGKAWEQEEGMQSSSEGDSKTTSYSYDAIGRLAELTDKDGIIRYEYDPCGNITKVEETKKRNGNIQTIEKTYDKNNRISSIIDANGNKICYTYNKYGSIQTLTYPDGSTVTYDTYDNGQLKTVTDWEGSQTSYEYDNDGRLTKTTRADGSTETYEYDTAGKLTLQTDMKGDQLLQTISYTYNGYGEISRKVKTYGEGTKEAGKQTEEKVTESSKSSNISTGKASDADSTEEMQYNTANQLISYQGKIIEYDAYGNMVKGPVNGNMAAYTYDSRNRLTEFLDLTYEYDAENNRIASTDEQTKKTIRYIHNTNSDLSQLLVEEDETTTTKYVYGNELICAKTYEKNLEELKQGGEGQNKQSGRQQADKTYYFHYDNLKSTTLLTDATGNVVETYDYGTYGEVTSGDTTLTRFLYNGGLGVSSDNNGLYYMRARYYNPVIRRFINQDVETGSMDDSASLNRYAYVQGNPVSLTDPFGLSPDMELGNYEANALKRLFNVADKVADFLPVVGTARDIKRSYNAFKNGNIADGIKYGATAAISLAVPTAKLAAKGLKTAVKLAKNSLKAEKCLSKIAQIASEGIKLAGKAVRRAGDAGKKIVKTVKNGVSTVARTVKREAIKFHKNNRGCASLGVDIKFGKKRSSVSDKVYFGQKSVSPNFSANGKFKGASIQSISDKLVMGELSSDDIPIEYIIRDDKMITMNNRSLTALSKANMKPSKLINITGNAKEEAKLTQRLKEMGGKPSISILIRKTREIVYLAD